MFLVVGWLARGTRRRCYGAVLSVHARMVAALGYPLPHVFISARSALGVFPACALAVGCGGVPVFVGLSPPQRRAVLFFSEFAVAFVDAGLHRLQCFVFPDRLGAHGGLRLFP